jgi:pimeloyl-ACP methyl ester carboxylesterase
VKRGSAAALLLALSPAAVFAGEMRPVTVNGAALEYAVSGKGEAVLLIHGSVIADGFAPLVGEPALAKYRLIRYHRRGYAGSGRARGPVTIAEQAADARALLERLGVERAHVVGHSYGAIIGLQLALDAPGLVRSLALLEPPLFTAVPSGPAYAAGLGPIIQLHTDGDNAAAIDAFLARIAGPDRPTIERALGPTAVRMAVADADTFFDVELPAMRQWTFPRETAARIHKPVLTMAGANTAPAFKEVSALLMEWYPGAQEVVVPAATHALQMVNPGAVAQALARFYIGQRATK